MNTDAAVAALAALAQDSRLAVYRLLVKRGPEGYAASEIGQRLGIPNTTLSFHLKTLAHAELVVMRKESRFIYYSANFDRMTSLVSFLTENCCSLGTLCAPSCVPSKPARPRKSA